MSLQKMLQLVWGKYGLAGAVVLLVCLVVLDQLYHFGLGEMVKGFFGLSG